MSDWASEAADRVEQVGEVLRDKVVIPARRGAAAVVWGILASSFAFLAVIIAVIAVFRLLVHATGSAWAAYLILGGICLAAGVLCWTKRGPRLDLATHTDS